MPGNQSAPQRVTNAIPLYPERAAFERILTLRSPLLQNYSRGVPLTESFGSKSDQRLLANPSLDDFPIAIVFLESKEHFDPAP